MQADLGRAAQGAIVAAGVAHIRSVIRVGVMAKLHLEQPLDIAMRSQRHPEEREDNGQNQTPDGQREMWIATTAFPFKQILGVPSTPAGPDRSLCPRFQYHPPSVGGFLTYEGPPSDRFQGFDGRHEIRARSRTKDGHEALASTGKDPLERTTEISAKTDTEGASDFTGPVVHGKPSDRFSSRTRSRGPGRHRGTFRRGRMTGKHRLTRRRETIVFHAHEHEHRQGQHPRATH